MERKDLQTKINNIAENISNIVVIKEQLQASIDKVYADDSRTSQWKNEQIEIYKESATKKINGLHNEIAESLSEVEEYINRPFDFSQKSEIDAEIDYLIAMQSAGCLSGAMVVNTLNKYRGDENALLYLRGKLTSAGLNEHYFDDCTFGNFERDISTGRVVYTAPGAFFKELNETIVKGTPALILYGMNQLTQILGIESQGLENLESKFMAKSVEHSPVY